MQKEVEAAGKASHLTYAFALLFVAFLVGFFSLFVYKAISSQATDTRVVNLAGRQRMFSQRITQLSLRLEKSGDLKEFARINTELGSALSAFKETQNGLESGNEALGLPGNNSPEVTRLFRQIGVAFTIMTDNASLLQNATYPLATSSRGSVGALMSVEASFLEQMDAIVFQYDAEARARVGKAQTAALGTLIVIVVTLLLEGMFIFRPETIHLQSALDKLMMYKRSLDAASNLIIITDADGHILFANDAAETMTGYSREEILGQTPKLWGGNMGEDFYQALWTTIKTDKKPFRGEVLNRKKNGEQYYVVLSISPMLDQHGDISGFVGVEADISEQKALIVKGRADMDRSS